MKVLQVGPAVIVILNVMVWLAIHVLSGYVAAKRKRASFDPDQGIYRIARFEAEGRLYDRLGVKMWKGSLPDFGHVFKPGFRKKRLRSRDSQYLEQFCLETCRAEFAHWLTMAGAPVFLLWNEWWVGPIMVGYALAVNLPCIIVQRYNRTRLMKSRRHWRSTCES